MPVKVNVKPQLLRWARERAEMDQAELARRIGVSVQKVAEWERTGQLTLGHIQRLAQKTYTPVGYLFLAEAPDEPLPVADFRMHSLGHPEQPSPELLDTLYLCQQRQGWYRDYLLSQGEAPLPFVGSASPSDAPDIVASRIRQALGLLPGQRAEFPTWSDALRDLFDKVEGIGILVMRNGVVGNNTHRKLDVTEFRGFALSDDLAPVIFVNVADSLSAQMFTLVHELGHLWRGESGVSDVDPESNVAPERFSNQVAAEVLVPMAEFRREWNRNEDARVETQRLARHFKVSTLALLIRAKEAGVVDARTFEALYEFESQHAQRPREGGGGDFYRTQRTRLGTRFASAVVVSALEGATPYKEAFELLGIRKSETFDEFARVLGLRV